MADVLGIDPAGDVLGIDPANDTFSIDDLTGAAAVPIPALALQLITSEHVTRPNFMASVALSIQPFIDSTVAVQSMPGLFDLDVAIGDQLDKTGQWIGRNRLVEVPITNVYFSFDIPGLGFDEGIWQGPFDPSYGVETLDDGTYRILLKAQVVANQWDGSVAEFYDAIEPLIAPTGITVQDNGDMTITVALTGPSPPPIVLALLVEQIISFRPAGVQQIGP